MYTDSTRKQLEADLQLNQIRDRFGTKKREAVNDFHKNLDKVRTDRAEVISSLRGDLDRNIHEMRSKGETELSEKDQKFQKDIEGIRRVRDARLRSIEAEQMAEMQKIRVEMQKKEREARQDYIKARREAHS